MQRVIEEIIGCGVLTFRGGGWRIGGREEKVWDRKSPYIGSKILYVWDQKSLYQDRVIR